ncbi:MAG: 23S rRNA (uracil(1939)-C(5))-methyltransferase RlmD [candidate division KSB1 bacterium]|nr:23S rRNA (uracil(1939)-C(5))-methyltransferase RlmD [candidate division KSB1 bacterium]MDZ7391290.1 23S rRNA (uracil(1939)-C(5))-methyltransferase RlmD [candidate division KSB1 bacterium]MDZ7412016.1 23S rRNA (uracil(1939)-C(5))-methyltransferase RlmD [candidate division KSB1 bacterium]
MEEAKVEKGAELTLPIASLAFGGKGVARVGDFVVFVEGALPGQEARVRIIRRRRSYAEAKIIEVVRESPLATTPACPHFPDCGGCQLQNLRYEAQLEAKRQHVVDNLQRVAGLPSPPVAPILASPAQFFYRNKMEFAFADRQWVPTQLLGDGEFQREGLFLGLHPRGRYDTVVEVTNCQLLSPLSNEILAYLRAFARDSGLPAYSTKSRQGFWRHAVIREGKQTGEVLVNLVVSESREETLSALASGLVREFPSVVGVVATVSTSPANVAYGEDQRVLVGRPYIEERLGRYVFEVTSTSFFQSNPQQAERLYGIAVQYAALQGEEVVYDLYCGTGTISVFLAEKAREVWGFELAEEAVRDAHRNCVRNGVGNCRFVSGDVRTTLARVLERDEAPRPEVVVLDPPRAGVHPRVLKLVCEIAPRRVVYVSCHPATLARDVAMLVQCGYQLLGVTPVDMFPQTWHVEAVALLQKGT